MNTAGIGTIVLLKTIPVAGLHRASPSTSLDKLYEIYLITLVI
jgi:hypothetical protein